jgi:predicted RNA-binding protein with PIN domain
MSLIIDGYNLLHAIGLAAKAGGPGGLERARTAMLNFLAASLEREQLKHAVVAFDAAHAPRGLPSEAEHRGLSVRFAARHETADELIEELIRIDSAPRKLTVVSSDHRLQQAARRRRATAIDSEAWYEQLLQARHRRQQAKPQPSEGQSLASRGQDIEYWLREFDDAAEGLAELDNPFPPGYAEEIDENGKSEE